MSRETERLREVSVSLVKTISREPETIPALRVVEESEYKELLELNQKLRDSVLAADSQYLGAIRVIEKRSGKKDDVIEELEYKIDKLEKSVRRKLITIKRYEGTIEDLKSELGYRINELGYRINSACSAGEPDPGGEGPNMGISGSPDLPGIPGDEFTPENYQALKAENQELKDENKSLRARMRALRKGQITEKRARWAIQKLKEMHAGNKSNWAGNCLLDSSTLAKMLLHEAPLDFSFDQALANISQSVIYVMRKIIKIAIKEGLPIFEGTTHSKFTEKMKIIRYDPHKYRPAALAAGIKRKYEKKKLESTKKQKEEDKEYASWYQNISGKVGPALSRSNPLDEILEKYVNNPDRGKITRS